METPTPTFHSPGTELVDAWWSLSQAIKRHIAPVLAREHGLDFKDFVALNAIEQGALHPGQLCERIGLAPSNVSRVLDELTRGGLVSRQLDPKDSRRVRLSLTGKGDAVLRATRETALELLDGGLRHLSPAQQQAFAGALRDLAQRLAQPASSTNQDSASQDSLHQDSLNQESA